MMFCNKPPQTRALENFKRNGMNWSMVLPVPRTMHGSPQVAPLPPISTSSHGQIHTDPNIYEPREVPSESSFTVLLEREGCFQLCHALPRRQTLPSDRTWFRNTQANSESCSEDGSTYSAYIFPLVGLARPPLLPWISLNAKPYEFWIVLFLLTQHF